MDCVEARELKQSSVIHCFCHKPFTTQFTLFQATVSAKAAVTVGFNTVRPECQIDLIF